MIYGIGITDPARVAVPWWSSVKALQNKTRIEFTPGLNILWGHNGSGKSTVLKLIARMLHCEQSGDQVVTDTSRHEIFHGTRGEGSHLGAAIDHDGVPVMHFDPGHAVGLIGGMAGFDDEFLGMGIVNTLFKGSAGETTVQRAKALFSRLLGHTGIPSVTWQNGVPDLVRTPWNEYDRKHLEQDRWIVETLKGNREVQGEPRGTFLLDEPERSLSIPWQAGIWKRLPLFAIDRQIIVATHSPFAIDVPGANYIEFSEGYLGECRQVMDHLWWLQGRKEYHP